MGAKPNTKKEIQDIWDENLILSNRRAKDRELNQYHIKNFDIDSDITKVFNKNHKISHSISGFETLI